MKKRLSIFEARFFGLLIGAVVFLLFILLSNFVLFKNAENFVRDFQIKMRNQVEVRTEQKGVTVRTGSGQISDDIIILGVDTNSINAFGRWPWGRFRHADLLSTLARIKDQKQRESSIMLDFFFFEPSEQPQFDAALKSSIRENGNTLLESVLIDTRVDPDDPQNIVQGEVFDTIAEKQPGLQNIQGDISRMPSFFGMDGPLRPFAQEARAFGHATFYPDPDQIFRSQLLVAKISRLKDLRAFDIKDDRLRKPAERYTRYVWFDKSSKDHTIRTPLSPSQIDELAAVLEVESPVAKKIGPNGAESSYHELYTYDEFFMPSITLTIASKYLAVPLDQIQVELGRRIILPNPTVLNTETGQRSPLLDRNGSPLTAMEIPINDEGGMLVNYMGQRSSEPGFGDQVTYTVRSYFGYASIATPPDPEKWKDTLALGNKMLLAGAFSLGMAADEKQTPVGLMYGVEIHANALNTIVTGNFIRQLPDWSRVIILLILIMAIAFLSSRTSPVLGLLVTIGSVVLYFFVSLFVFEFTSVVVDFVQPSLGMIFTMVAIIVYRVVTEERDKKMIKATFGKYVSPQVVDQLIQTPPELGGVDKEISVFFSDIRGFTTLSESMTPQELVNHLNEYLTAMTDIIHEFYGTLDKYVGDEIMCFWGAPLPQEDHALLACRCALRQMQKLAELNSQWPPERRIDIGIGVNSGIMTVGNMGSIGRMNYTLMGDNVNLGARLEGTNKEYGSHIIISEYTYGMVKDWVVVRELDNIRVKGKNKPVLIYELVDVTEG